MSVGVVDCAIADLTWYQILEGLFHSILASRALTPDIYKVGVCRSLIRSVHGYGVVYVSRPKSP